jgi:hypothetical protein
MVRNCKIKAVDGLLDLGKQSYIKIVNFHFLIEDVTGERVKE